MSTNMTGFRCFSEHFAFFLIDEISLSVEKVNYMKLPLTAAHTSQHEGSLLFISGFLKWTVRNLINIKSLRARKYH